MTAQTGTPSTDVDAHFIQIVDVVKQFGDATAVNQVSLSIRRHEIFALLGSSGCGKSTLLRMLAGFETPTSGRLLIDGEDVTGMPPYRRPVNMMFQSYALFPHMTVAGNVGYGLRQEGVRGAVLRERVAAALELVQMGAFAERRPDQLSGGQQQRVALARSLVKRPKLLLLDEPMSALDKQIRQRTQIELINILETVGVTCIMVTHDQEEAMTMADRVAVMTAGRIVQIGRPDEVYERPNSRFSAQFIGTTNLFEGRIIEYDGDRMLIDTPDLPQPLDVRAGSAAGGEGLRPGDGIAVSVRPERVRLSRGRGNAGVPGSLGDDAAVAPTLTVATVATVAIDAAHNMAAGVVVQTAYMGAHTVCHIRLPSGKMIMANVASLELSQSGNPEIGETLYVQWGRDSGVILSS